MLAEIKSMWVGGLLCDKALAKFRSGFADFDMSLCLMEQSSGRLTAC